MHPVSVRASGMVMIMGVSVAHARAFHPHRESKCTRDPMHGEEGTLFFQLACTTLCNAPADAIEPVRKECTCLWLYACVAGHAKHMLFSAHIPYHTRVVKYRTCCLTSTYPHSFVTGTWCQAGSHCNGATPSCHCPPAHCVAPIL